MRNRITWGSIPAYLVVFLLGAAITVGCNDQVKPPSQDSAGQVLPPSNRSGIAIEQPNDASKPTQIRSTESNPIPSQPTASNVNRLPRMVDLGADKCVPCKAMAPILRDLKAEYKGKVEVEFIDVWKDPNPGKQYRIRVIPTQIFFDAQGKELFRHEGFYSREDILAKWMEFEFIKG